MIPVGTLVKRWAAKHLHTKQAMAVEWPICALYLSLASLPSYKQISSPTVG